MAYSSVAQCRLLVPRPAGPPESGGNGAEARLEARRVGREASNPPNAGMSLVPGFLRFRPVRQSFSDGGFPAFRFGFPSFGPIRVHP